MVLKMHIKTHGFSIWNTLLWINMLSDGTQNPNFKNLYKNRWILNTSTEIQQRKNRVYLLNN